MVTVNPEPAQKGKYSPLHRVTAIYRTDEALYAILQSLRRLDSRSRRSTSSSVKRRRKNSTSPARNWGPSCAFFAIWQCSSRTKRRLTNNLMRLCGTGACPSMCSRATTTKRRCARGADLESSQSGRRSLLGAIEHRALLRAWSLMACERQLIWLLGVFVVPFAGGLIHLLLVVILGRLLNPPPPNDESR